MMPYSPAQRCLLSMKLPTEALLTPIASQAMLTMRKNGMCCCARAVADSAARSKNVLLSGFNRDLNSGCNDAKGQ